MAGLTDFLSSIPEFLGLIFQSYQHFLTDIGQELLSTTILSLQLIDQTEVGQLSVTDERMCSVQVNSLG